MQHQLPLTRRRFVRTASAALAGLGSLSSIPANPPRALADEGKAENTEKTGSKTGVKPLTVVIYLYDRMTALDAIGPYEVFRLMPGVQVRFVARKAGLVRPDSGLQMLHAEYGITDIDHADILVVPGGDASAQIADKEVLQWIQGLHAKTKWTTSSASVP
jgi:putative intracellular protease/amidase